MTAVALTGHISVRVIAGRGAGGLWRRHVLFDGNKRMEMAQSQVDLDVRHR
jgi:prophage maintenance system killer protein